MPPPPPPMTDGSKKAHVKLLLDYTEILLNLIFEKRVFPEEWTLGAITILFKDGETNYLNNYRGITLFSMLRKILVGVLNSR